MPRRPSLRLRLWRNRLICCARRELAPDDVAEIRRLLRGSLDPDRLVVLASRHKMLPLAWWHLKREIEHVPPAVAGPLRTAFAHNATQMLALRADDVIASTPVMQSS